jgi:hypothetical protein
MPSPHCLQTLRLHQRHYRLVDRQGQPHPVLDDLYDSLDWRTLRYPGS